MYCTYFVAMEDSVKLGTGKFKYWNRNVVDRTVVFELGSSHVLT